MKDPTREEIIAAIPSCYKSEDGFEIEVEVALYWFATHYHNGQWSNLYKVLSSSQYSPGINQTSISGEGDFAEELLAVMIDTFKD